MAALSTLRNDARGKARRANKKVTPVASDVRDNVVRAAGSTYDWAAPKVEASKDWAAPKVEASKDWAAPKVEPAVEKLKDDVLPRVAGAVAAALAASEPAREEAKTRGTAAVAALRGELAPPAKPRRRRTRRFLLLVTVLGGAYAGWRAWNSQNHLDQAEPWASSTGPSYGSVPTVTHPTTDEAEGDEGAPAAEVTDDVAPPDASKAGPADG